MPYRMSWPAVIALLAALAVPHGHAQPDTIVQPALALRLNVPAFRLDLVEHGAVRATYEVAVGEPRYPTPLGEFRITHIVWNPWWRPPPSEWARDEKVQPPGAKNPMGPVKLQFGDLYFLHGTPYENTIGKAASHGCLRMRDADARALARTLNRVGGGGLSDATIDTLEADSSRTLTVELLEPVPIEIAYVTVELDGERLYLHRDIYRRDPHSEARTLEALTAAGHDTSRVDHSLLRTLVRRARSRAVSVAIDTLLGTMPVVAQSHARASDDAGAEAASLAGPACVGR
jgi:murein L,D-transpeptidase YcbB/YkuD